MAKICLPTTTTSTTDLENFVNKLNLNCKIYMKNEICGMKIDVNQSAIINLQSTGEQGSHWVCAIRTENDHIYFDSFGLPPPCVIVNYLRSTPVVYIKRNSIVVQHYESQICGSLCLYVINQIFAGESFGKILLCLRERFENKTISLCLGEINLHNN